MAVFPNTTSFGGTNTAADLTLLVYITTAPEHDGSLSGARLREAISWGKMRPEAPNVCVEGDASVLLPLIGADVLQRGDASVNHRQKMALLMTALMALMPLAGWLRGK